VTKPWNADASAKPCGVDAFAKGIDHTNNVMAGNEWKFGILEIAIHNVQVGAADGTGLHLDP
jgi:hypothetical protein